MVNKNLDYTAVLAVKLAQLRLLLVVRILTPTSTIIFAATTSTTRVPPPQPAPPLLRPPQPSPPMWPESHELRDKADDVTRLHYSLGFRVHAKISSVVAAALTQPPPALTRSYHKQGHCHHFSNTLNPKPQNPKSLNPKP